MRPTQTPSFGLLGLCAVGAAAIGCATAPPVVTAQRSKVRLLSRAVPENGALLLALPAGLRAPELQLFERRRARWSSVPLATERWKGTRASKQRLDYLLVRKRVGSFRRGASYRLHLVGRREQLIAIRPDSDRPAKISLGRLRHNKQGQPMLDVLADKDDAPVLLLELKTQAGPTVRRAIRPGKRSAIALPKASRAPKTAKSAETAETSKRGDRADCVSSVKLTDPAGNQRTQPGTCTP